MHTNRYIFSKKFAKSKMYLHDSGNGMDSEVEKLTEQATAESSHSQHAALLLFLYYFFVAT